MVKLGFINPKLKGYHPLTKNFLKSETTKERELIFSEILYKNANFQSSVTRDNSSIKQINFFLKTLMYHPKQRLGKEEIIALMSTDISQYKHGRLSFSELETQVKIMKIKKFRDRKYNQINYFFKFLKYIPGISVARDQSYVQYTEDASVILAENIDVRRDPTMFRIMRENIKQESKKIYGDVVCYFTKRPQKNLVVSHIVRSSDALRNLDVETAYDYRNALLLEPNTDAYYDKFDISFLKNGSPVFGNEVPNSFVEEKKELKLDSIILTGREGYLERHLKKFREKNEI